MHTTIIAGTRKPFIAFVELWLAIPSSTRIRHVSNAFATWGNILSDFPIPLCRSCPNLNRLSKNITKTLIQRTTFIRIHQCCSIRGHRVGDFMSAHIQSSKWRKGCPVSITVSHYAAVPERIVVVTAVMDITQNFRAVIVETVPTMFTIEIIIGHLWAPMCIGSYLVFGRIYIVPSFVGIRKINRRSIVGALFHVVRFDTLTPACLAQSIRTRR